MKIHFTKKEFRLLIDMISIAEWVMSSHKTGENPKSEPYEKLEQKILSYAKDFGFDNLIIYDKQMGKYFPTREYEDAGTDRPFIEEFEEEVFWEELGSRLAQRDLINEVGIKKLREMDPIERLTAEDEIAEKYHKEFASNGLKNLKISEE
ncbi:MAG: hypothetical protein P8130_07715 [Deltaproteobacteria bacterium]